MVEYQIFVDSPGPFGAEFNSHHAFFNLAQVLMYPVEARSSPMVVRFNQVPEGWLIATPLTSMPEGRFGADNYDRLVDSPVEIGDFKESDFDEGGAHYRVIVDAEAADYDMAKLDGMLHKIVAAATSWMDDRPLRQLHVPLSLSAWTGRRRHGTFFLHSHRRECGCAAAGSRGA